jgi:hypothetical protein
MTYQPTTKQLEIAIGDGFGICLNCGEMTAEVVDRDEHQQACEHCESSAVHGASTLAFMGEEK